MNNKEQIIKELENLLNMIDLKNINIKQIKSNVDKLLEIYKELKNIWKSIDNFEINYKIYLKTNSKYSKIKSILLNSFLSLNPHIKNIINNKTYIHCLTYSNIKLYWLNNYKRKNTSETDYLIGYKMLKISICLNIYKYNYNDTIRRIIIWIPTNKERNFEYLQINSLNLKKTEDNFEAFVASGVTYSNNPRITIITRYEEVEKLLIHELIHNYYLDGSNYHNELIPIISKYKKIKNNNLNEDKQNYDYEYSMYESYTELLSTYFYLLFKNLSENIQIDNIKNILIGQILIELLYSYNLICNLVNLGNYESYEDFKNKLIFESHICSYEYYFVKGLMYNNYNIIIGNNLNEFENIYNRIIIMIEKIKLHDDKLLKQIYSFCKKQINFKYQIH